MEKWRNSIIGYFKSGLGRTIFSLIAVTTVLLIIHEAGHIPIQIMAGIPISIGTDNVFYGFSTMYGSNIFDYPPNTIFAAAFAGFISTLIPIRYLKKWIFFPEVFNRLRSITPDELRLIFYLLVCIFLASHDFAIITRMLFAWFT